MTIRSRASTPPGKKVARGQNAAFYHTIKDEGTPNSALWRHRYMFLKDSRKMFSYFNSTVKFVQGLSLHRFSPWDHLGTFSNFPKLLTFSILIKCTVNYRRWVLSVSTHRKGVTFVNLYQLFEPFNSRSQCAICHLILRRHHRLLHSSEVLNYLERFLVQLFINVVK